MAEYIERDAAIDALRRRLGPNTSPAQRNMLQLAVIEIRSIRVADVATVRHGRWLPQVVLGQKAWDCSECKTLGSPNWKWCPVCGCKMDLEAT